MSRWRKLSQLWTPFTKSNASVYATSACYYIILSVFPASMLLSGLLSRVPISLYALYQGLQQLIPSQFFPILQLLQSASGSAVLASVSVVVLLWSASKGVLAISDGLRALTGSHHKKRFFRRRFRAIISFLFLFALLFFVFGLFVLSQNLLSLLGILSGPVYRLRYLYAPVALTAMFAVIYHYFPEKSLPFRFCLLGGSFSAIGWIVFSSLFSLYITLTGGLQQKYGSSGLFLLACIWLQFCISLLLYGGLLADLLAHRDYHPVTILRSAFRPS